MKQNRREMMGIVVAAGMAAFAAKAEAADLLSEAEYKKLAPAPKSAADHRMLAKHYRALAAQHLAESKELDAIGATYAKGLPNMEAAWSRDLSRGVKHAAEHSRDFAEALDHLAEAHEGYAENMK